MQWLINVVMFLVVLRAVGGYLSLLFTGGWVPFMRYALLLTAFIFMLNGIIYPAVALMLLIGIERAEKDDAELRAHNREARRMK